MDRLKNFTSIGCVEGLANRIALEGRWEATARKHTCLLGWNAGQTIPEPLINNGTCCLLQTRLCRFLVTCEHVWQGYDTFRAANRDSRLWISLVRDEQFRSPSYAFMPSNPRVIASDAELDLAVISFDEINQFEPWRFFRFRPPTCTKAQKGGIVHFLGFPGEAVRSGSVNRVLNYCFFSQVIHDVSYSRFLLHSAPGTAHHENQEGKEMGAFKVGGTSGAPVFKVNDNFELSLAGVVSDLSSSGLGALAPQSYELSDGDIYVTHASFIQEDGTIASA